MDDLQEDLTPEKKGVPKFLWGMLAVVAIVLVGVAAYKNGTGFDILSRYFTYAEPYVDAAYSYDDGSQTQFALLDTTLVALTDTKIEVQSYGGKTLYTDLCYMQNPALEVGGKYALAYDVGGDDYYVLSQEGLVYKGVIEGGQTLISASINAMDMITLTHEKSGYKSTTSVYNSNLELVYYFDSSRNFILDGYVTNDGSTLVEVTLGADTGAFASRLLYYPLTDSTLSNSMTVAEILPLEITQKGELILLLGDTGIAYVNMDGELENQYNFDTYYLRDFDCSGDVFSAVLLNRYQAGNEAQVVSIDHTGNQLAAINITEEVMDISVSGNYLAVLYSSSLVIYTSELVPYATINDLDYASHVLMQSDGSAVVFARERAEIISP